MHVCMHFSVLERKGKGLVQCSCSEGVCTSDSGVEAENNDKILDEITPYSLGLS